MEKNDTFFLYKFKVLKILYKKNSYPIFLDKMFNFLYVTVLCLFAMATYAVAFGLRHSNNKHKFLELSTPTLVPTQMPIKMLSPEPTQMPIKMLSPEPTQMPTMTTINHKPIYDNFGYFSDGYLNDEIITNPNWRNNIEPAVKYLSFICEFEYTADDIMNALFVSVTDNYKVNNKIRTYHMNRNFSSSAPMYAYYDKIEKPIRDEVNPNGETIIVNGYVKCPITNMLRGTEIHFDYSTQPIKEIFNDDGQLLKVYGNVCYPDFSKFSEVFGYNSYAIYCVYNSDYQVPFAPGYISTFSDATPINPNSYIGIPKKKFVYDDDNNNYPLINNNSTNDFWSSFNSSTGYLGMFMSLFTYSSTPKSLRG